MQSGPRDPGNGPAQYPPEPYYSEPIRLRFNLRDEDLRPSRRTETESNISYYPDSAEHALRTRRLEQLATRETDLPAGWPSELTGDMAWEPDQLVDESRFIYRLSADDDAEIMEALESFRARHSDLEKVTMETFPLPTLGAVLLQIRNRVATGIGFTVIRGLELGRFDHEARAIVFLGLSSYIGEERGPQDFLGTMIKHIMDDEQSESYRELPFHTDVTCDVSAILTVECSDHGGMWTVASAFTVYNTFAKSRPDLVHVLAKPDWPFDTFGRDPSYYLRAPLYYVDGKIIFNFSRRLLTGHPIHGRSPGVPRLSEVQAEAIDAVHFTASDHQLKVAMQRGDLRFVNNQCLLHGREGFHDNGRRESRRHVMRIWLKNKEMSRNLPTALQLAWARIFDDQERHRQWIVEPYEKDGVVYGRGPRAECD